MSVAIKLIVKKIKSFNEEYSKLSDEAVEVIVSSYLSQDIDKLIKILEQLKIEVNEHITNVINSIVLTQNKDEEGCNIKNNVIRFMTVINKQLIGELKKLINKIVMMNSKADVLKHFFDLLITNIADNQAYGKGYLNSDEIVDIYNKTAQVIGIKQIKSHQTLLRNHELKKYVEAEKKKVDRRVSWQWILKQID